jgi:hypothetical protein
VRLILFIGIICLFSSTKLFGENLGSDEIDFSHLIDDRNDIDDYMHSVVLKLKHKNFAWLEKEAKANWKSGRRLRNGDWKTLWYYEGLGNLETGDRTSNIAIDENADLHALWKKRLKLIKAWQRRYPDSSTANIVEALWHSRYAWAVRGGKVYVDVKIEAWPTFEKELKESERIVAKLSPKDPSVKVDPQLYHIHLLNSIGLGIPKGELKEFYVTRCLANEPDYFHNMGFMAIGLQPKWGGTESEFMDFCLEAHRGDSPQRKCEFVARGMMNLRQSEPLGNFFSNNNRHAWDIGYWGFKEIFRKYPHSVSNANFFATIAYGAGDYGRVTPCMNGIGEMAYLTAWRKRSNFDRAKALGGEMPIKSAIAPLDSLFGPEGNFLLGPATATATPVIQPSPTVTLTPAVTVVAWPTASIIYPHTGITVRAKKWHGPLPTAEPQ